MSAPDHFAASLAAAEERLRCARARYDGAIVLREAVFDDVETAAANGDAAVLAFARETLVHARAKVDEAEAERDAAFDTRAALMAVMP